MYAGKDYKESCDKVLLSRGKGRNVQLDINKDASSFLYLKQLQNKRRNKLTTLKTQFEKATNFDKLYEGLLSYTSKIMTDLEASEQEDTVTYDQASKLFSHLNSEEGKSEYAQMRWDDISSRCTEEELSKAVEVQQMVSDNLELLQKVELSPEGNTEILKMLGAKIGMEVPVSGDGEV